MTQTKSSAAPFHKIAVATDFAAATSAHAVALASTIATICAAELMVVHVVESAAYPQIGPDTAALRRIGLGTLDAAVIRIRDDVPGARGVLLVGHPAEEVVTFAEKNAIDLVVSGTHGRQSVERWLLGSVAEKIVRSCHAPVLTVHDEARAFRRLLVATDFGPSSERAVELAARMATTFGARLTLVHVVGDDVPVDAAGKRLEEVAAGIRYLAPECDVLVRQGTAWSELTHEAEKGDYDLVILGTHGRKALPQWLLGGVAEKVVRSSLPPVLTVRAPDDG